MAARLLTLPEAGRYLGRSREFVAALIAGGHVPALEVGRRQYVPERALAALGDVPTATPAVKAPAVFPRRLPRTA